MLRRSYAVRALSVQLLHRRWVSALKTKLADPLTTQLADPSVAPASLLSVLTRLAVTSEPRTATDAARSAAFRRVRLQDVLDPPPNLCRRYTAPYSSNDSEPWSLELPARSNSGVVLRGEPALGVSHTAGSRQEPLLLCADRAVPQDGSGGWFYFEVEVQMCSHEVEKDNGTAETDGTPGLGFCPKKAKEAGEAVSGTALLA